MKEVYYSVCVSRNVADGWNDWYRIRRSIKARKVTHNQVATLPDFVNIC